MLVLSRLENQTVLIGDEIRVRVVRVGGGRVRLGITAPQGTRVMREEVLEASDAEGKETQEGA